MYKLINGKLVELTPAEIAAMEAEIAAMESERIAFESSREFKLMRINELKAQLSATDYKALKYVEGWLTEDEYAPVKAQRQAIRDEINAIEAEISCM